MNRLFLFAILLLTFASCGKSYLVEETVTFENGIWNYEDTLDFTLKVENTEKLYSIFMDIEHSTDYSFQNLYLNIFTKFPSGERLKKQVGIDLADKTGKWHGECSKTKCTLPITIQENAFFEKAGDYQFTVEQYTRQDSLPGLRSITFKVEDTGLTKQQQ